MGTPFWWKPICLTNFVAILIFNNTLLPFDIEIIRETFYNLSRNKFESDDENADILLCFTRKI